MTEIKTITMALFEMGIRYSCDAEITLVSRAEMCEKFPGEDEKDSSTQCQTVIAEKTQFKISWSIFDDNWFAIDSIRPV